MHLTAWKPAKRLVGPFGCAVLAGALWASPSFAAESEAECLASATHLTVVVEGLRSDRGDVIIEVYPDSTAKFLGKNGRLNRVHHAPGRPSVTACVPVPGPGEYEVVLYHDEDGDGKFDRNALGLPTEGFGISNNPGLAFRKPTVQEARFRAGEGDTVIHIKVRYLLGGHMP